MKTRPWLGAVAVVLCLSSSASAQERTLVSAEGAGDRRHFLGSSAFMAANLFPDSASFYQLSYGYRLTPRDVLVVEAITWTYRAPLGIPYWASADAPDRAYPGSVREYGVGLAYQRFLWRNLYAAVHATPLLQQYRDADGKRIQNGFQLFLTLRAGYHLGFFDDRLFVEPSVAFTHWPIKAHVPDAFARIDARWPNYFLFEPGLHFGVRF
jgi:hypothetical protein